MGYLIALFAVLVRLFRPSQAVHASPYGRCAGVLAELRRNRSKRVRRYVSAPLALAPVVPAPRKPVDTVPRTAMSAVAPVCATRHPLPPANIVRPGYRAFERAQAQRRIDRDRLGVAVLREIATAAQVTA